MNKLQKQPRVIFIKCAIGFIIGFGGMFLLDRGLNILYYSLWGLLGMLIGGLLSTRKAQRKGNIETCVDRTMTFSQIILKSRLFAFGAGFLFAFTIHRLLWFLMIKENPDSIWDLGFPVMLILPHLSFDNIGWFSAIIWGVICGLFSLLIKRAVTKTRSGF